MVAFLTDGRTEGFQESCQARNSVRGFKEGGDPNHSLERELETVGEVTERPKVQHWKDSRRVASGTAKNAGNHVFSATKRHFQ